jgi:L-ascorbate metabolism protein UlaG (beta-lactamase superfamily)
MKLTKYGHACVVLEERGKKLIIDPGAFTPEFGDVSNVVAVVVTHSHADHFKPEHLETILAASGDAKIFTTPEVTEQFSKPRVTAVKAGDDASAGPFTLAFGGEMHQVIHDSAPCPQNISVFVNDELYYPGDSYTMPDQPVKVLAVPTNAPWMKVADSMDYLAAVKPTMCFPTHNGLLSENGVNVYNFWLSKACEESAIEFKYLTPGDSIEI